MLVCFLVCLVKCPFCSRRYDAGRGVLVEPHCMLKTATGSGVREKTLLVIGENGGLPIIQREVF